MNQLTVRKDVSRNLSLLLFFSITLIIAKLSFAAEEEHEHDEAEMEVVEISASMAQELGIETEIVSGGMINRSLLLYGKTMPDPQSVSHVAARYPGMIRAMIPALGDTVTAGQVIAIIEANNSLQTYEILAPLSGTVVEKHANPGEQATTQSLLTIANYENIWVDLTIFPGDSQQVRSGMPVTIRMEALSADSSISYMNASQGQSPTVIARVPLENTESRWTPGLLVEGLVHIESTDVGIAVKNDALQLFENNQVVFVLEGEVYEPRPVVLGRSDNSMTEVLAGLNIGERYVVSNSYLIKADLEKDGVEHDH